MSIMGGRATRRESVVPSLATMRMSIEEVCKRLDAAEATLASPDARMDEMINAAKTALQAEIRPLQQAMFASCKRVEEALRLLNQKGANGGFQGAWGHYSGLAVLPSASARPYSTKIGLHGAPSSVAGTQADHDRRRQLMRAESSAEGLQCQGTRNSVSPDHSEQHKPSEFEEAGEETPGSQANARRSPSPEQIEDAVRRTWPSSEVSVALEAAPASPTSAQPVTPVQQGKARPAKVPEPPRRNSLVRPRTAPTGNRMPLLVKMRK